MAYIDETYINAYTTSDVRDALLADDSGDVIRDVLIADADAFVDAQLAQAGYATGLTGTIPRIVKVASLEVFLKLAYGRRGLLVPDGLKDAIAIAATTAGSSAVVSVAEAIGRGDVPIPGMAPTARDAVGGITFSETSSTFASNRAPVFSSDWIRRNRYGM